MTGPPALKQSAQSASSVNRTPQMVMVRLYNGDLAGRVSNEFAARMVASGAAQSVGKVRLRYVRLEPAYSITQSIRGWELVEKERRKHGDSKVRRGFMALDRHPLKWQSPNQSVDIAYVDISGRTAS